MSEDATMVERVLKSLKVIPPDLLTYVSRRAHATHGATEDRQKIAVHAAIILDYFLYERVLVGPVAAIQFLDLLLEKRLLPLAGDKALYVVAVDCDNRKSYLRFGLTGCYELPDLTPGPDDVFAEDYSGLIRKRAWRVEALIAAAIRGLDGVAPKAPTG